MSFALQIASSLFSSVLEPFLPQAYRHLHIVLFGVSGLDSSYPPYVIPNAHSSAAHCVQFIILIQFIFTFSLHDSLRSCIW